MKFAYCIDTVDTVDALPKGKLGDFQCIVHNLGIWHLDTDYCRDRNDIQYRPPEDRHISKRIQMDMCIHCGRKLGARNMRKITI